MKQKTSKKEAKTRERPKEVEPKSVTKTESKVDIEFEKIKLQKESRDTLARILDGLRQDYKDGLITKRQFQQRQQQIIEKFEKGGRIS